MQIWRKIISLLWQSKYIFLQEKKVRLNQYFSQIKFISNTVIQLELFGIIKFLLQSYKIKRKKKNLRYKQILNYRSSAWEPEYIESHWAENAS